MLLHPAISFTVAHFSVILSILISRPLGYYKDILGFLGLPADLEDLLRCTNIQLSPRAHTS